MTIAKPTMQNSYCRLVLFVMILTLTACGQNIPTSTSLTQSPIAPISSTETPAGIQTSTLTPTLNPANEIEYNMIQGNKIIDAIERYYEANGYYPENLDCLVPVYLAEIPLTKDGQTFKYRLNDYFIYGLSFNIPGTENVHGGCGYNKRSPFWECGVSVVP
jgi:ABC-type transport system substrate-binding protein